LSALAARRCRNSQPGRLRYGFMGKKMKKQPGKIVAIGDDFERF